MLDMRAIISTVVGAIISSCNSSRLVFENIRKIENLKIKSHILCPQNKFIKIVRLALLMVYDHCIRQLYDMYCILEYLGTSYFYPMNVEEVSLSAHHFHYDQMSFSGLFSLFVNPKNVVHLHFYNCTYKHSADVTDILRKGCHSPFHS